MAVAVTIDALIDLDTNSVRAEARMEFIRRNVLKNARLRFAAVTLLLAAKRLTRLVERIRDDESSASAALDDIATNWDKDDTTAAGGADTP